MRRSFIPSVPAAPIYCLALLGLGGALVASADAPVTIPSPALTSEGKLTPHTRAVIAEGNAYLLGQVETIVADAKTEKIVPSPTGDAVLVAVSKRRPFHGVTLTSPTPTTPADAEPLNGEINLVYWDTRTRTARTLLREAIRDDSIAEIGQIEWLPQTRSALVVVNRVAIKDGKPGMFEQSVIRFDTAAGSATRLASRQYDGEGVRLHNESLSVSPRQPLAYLLLQEYLPAPAGKRTVPRTSLRLYSPRGFRAPITLPDGVGRLQWTADGKSVYADRLSEPDAGKANTLKTRKVLTLVNLETGAVTQPDALPAISRTARTQESPSGRASWAVEIDTRPGTLQTASGKSQAVSTLWLRSAASVSASVPVSAPASKAATPLPKATGGAKGAISTEALLITTNARREAELATENSAAILFTRDGSLCAAPIFRVSVTAFEDALRGIQRTAAISNAKQAALALFGYMQDYEENLPPVGGETAGQIGPYVGNPEIFQNPATGENGFVYSYQGPTSFAQIALVAETQLGYVSGPGGRAIIWADGHVTWTENTPR
ncbi:MAG: hypothetical protein V4671_20080 [Armatimonadota bacterium]